MELEESFVVGLATLQSTRYLELRTPGIPKDLHFADEILPNLPMDRFQQFFRMSQSSFLHIHSQIKDNRVFQNNSKNPQVPSSKQLAVCLRRLACESSTAGMYSGMSPKYDMQPGVPGVCAFESIPPPQEHRRVGGGGSTDLTLVLS
ncbi:MAG: hypothetical protein JWM47_4480 [Acidimicrobiales bacterium]|nr:hypothetical protein [Acidimicrobiales bacterium]